MFHCNSSWSQARFWVILSLCQIIFSSFCQIWLRLVARQQQDRPCTIDSSLSLLHKTCKHKHMSSSWPVSSFCWWFSLFLLCYYPSPAFSLEAQKPHGSSIISNSAILLVGAFGNAWSHCSAIITILMQNFQRSGFTYLCNIYISTYITPIILCI